MFLNAIFFLGLCGYFTFVGIHKIENLDASQMNKGFVFGIALAIVWTSLGTVGALFLAKALLPFNGEFRAEELLIKYHDRLKELGQLADNKQSEQDGPPNDPPRGSFRGVQA